jgi:hypothetical protein
MNEAELYEKRVTEGLDKLVSLLRAHAYADDALATGMANILEKHFDADLSSITFVDPVDLRKQYDSKEAPF